MSEQEQHDGERSEINPIPPDDDAVDGEQVRDGYPVVRGIGRPRRLPSPSSTPPQLDHANFTDEAFWIDDRAGHGAQSVTEDWVRANHGPISHDGRSVTRTTFYYWEAEKIGPGQAHRKPENVRTWARLASWNDGEGASERSTQNFDADKRRWIETFGGQLECTSYQVERAKWIIERLDLSPFQGAHIPVENVILGVLSLLMDADVPKRLPAGDNAEVNVEDVRAVGRPMMQELMANLGMDRRDLKQIRQMLHKNASDLLKPETEFK